MRFHVLTLFPEMVMQTLDTSILKRAAENGLISFDAINIRDYCGNKHGKVDDYTYGGGAGMLMQADPIYNAYMALCERSDDEPDGSGNSEIKQNRPRVVYVTPQGKTFNQAMAGEFAKEDEIVFLCGHYEGIDDRVLDEIVTDYVSIGDYVLTGGELPAMVMIDAIARLVPGVLNNDESACTESFQDGLLEYPQYSRPPVWHDRQVPEILLSGDHAKVEQWRLEQAILRTKERRPDMYEAYKERIIAKEEALKPKKRKLTRFFREIDA